MGLFSKISFKCSLFGALKKRASNAPERALNEKDIVNVLREIGEWMAKNELHAHACVGGSAALVLQTNYRKHANDIHLYFTRMHDETGQELSRSDVGTVFELLSNHLNTRYDHTLIDKEYASVLMGKRDDSNGIPYAGYFSLDGYGVEIRLKDLAHIHQWKKVGVECGLYAENPEKKKAEFFDCKMLENIMAVQSQPSNTATFPSRYDLSLKRIDYRKIKVG